MVRFVFTLGVLVFGLYGWAGNSPTLRLSIYATAGDVLRFLATPEQRSNTLNRLRPLPVSRIFLEGRRGDTYVPPNVLVQVRDALEAEGIHCSGGIATVPGQHFGIRQNGGLSWLNWEAEKTRRDVAAFFSETAPIFSEIIIDDFYCTADTSPSSHAARGDRSWGQYRRDLLVSLIPAIILRPARNANPNVRLILKYPQWYDRFHRFGYDPQRMSPFFDRIWVGTEVRNPTTRRMGYVQPTEGYINFLWIRSIAGDRVVGAWFDHIECNAAQFVDQAYQSVLAGARELTLFHLGDIVAGHPGDTLLAARWSELQHIAQLVQTHRRRGIVFYKPLNSEGYDNQYLADALAMLGLPILPRARWVEDAPVVFLPAQAAADSQIGKKMRRCLARGGCLIVTPAFLRAAGRPVDELAGAGVSETPQPADTTALRIQGRQIPLPAPITLDLGLRVQDAEILMTAIVKGQAVPWLCSKKISPGTLWIWNVRTYSDADFQAAGEWLLSPGPLGLIQIPRQILNPLREGFLKPLAVHLDAPAGIALYLLDHSQILYNFHPHPISIRLNNTLVTLKPKQCRILPTTSCD